MGMVKLRNEEIHDHSLRFRRVEPNFAADGDG